MADAIDKQKECFDTILRHLQGIVEALKKLKEKNEKISN